MRLRSCLLLRIKRMFRSLGNGNLRFIHPPHTLLSTSFKPCYVIFHFHSASYTPIKKIKTLRRTVLWITTGVNDYQWPKFLLFWYYRYTECENTWDHLINFSLLYVKFCPISNSLIPTCRQKQDSANLLALCLADTPLCRVATSSQQLHTQIMWILCRFRMVTR